MLLAVTCLWLGLLAAANAQLSAAAQARMDKQVAAFMRDKAARTPAQNKMDAHLILAGREAQGFPAHPDLPRLTSGVKLGADRSVSLDLTGTITDKLLDAIRAVGGRIVNSHPEYNAARIDLPVSVIEAIAGRADVRFIRPAERGQPNTGSVDSEGDQAHQAPSARSTYGVAGAGVTVGVMSDSIDDESGSLAAAYNSGDLDFNNTFVIKDQAGTGEGEGLAMMEIVHDIAPGAKLIYATCNPSPAQMAANIKALAAAGCDIIIDDYNYPTESPFQDAVIAQAVNTVSAQGILYFSCARNSGNFDQQSSSTWEGDFKDGGDASGFDGHSGSRYHAFTSSTGDTSLFNAILENGGNQGSVSLFWSDPLGKATTDYDVYEVDFNGNIVAVGGDSQTGTQDPYEDTNQAAQPGDYIGIIKYSGPARFLKVEVGRLIVGTQTPGNVRGHNASGAANAFCVAATPASDPGGPYPGAFNSGDLTETFSCDGPRRIFYQPDGTPYTAGNFTSTGGKVLTKPDFTAADGVTTTLPANGGLNPFYGTSAAAPHAGALAALLLSYNPSLTPAQAGAALRKGVVVPSSSTGLTSRTYGKGILLAPKILAAAGPATPVITSKNTASATQGKAFTYQITATGSPTSYGVGGLFGGLKVDQKTGKITGSPTASGTHSLDLRATNAAGTGHLTLTLTVKGSPPVITSSLSDVTVTAGKAFTYQITATNSPTSYGVGGLFAGVTVNQQTGLISGTPTSAGTHTLTLRATNGAGTGSATLKVIVKVAAPAITSSGTATATVGKKFTYQITATNSPTSYGVGGLFAGVTVNQQTGLITGTPTAAGTHSLDLRATNAGGTGHKTLTLTVKSQ